MLISSVSEILCIELHYFLLKRYRGIVTLLQVTVSISEFRLSSPEDQKTLILGLLSKHMYEMLLFKASANFLTSSNS